MKITITQKGQKLVTVPFQIIKFQNLKSFLSFTILHLVIFLCFNSSKFKYTKNYNW